MSEPVDDIEYRELTADDLAERWAPIPLGERPVERSRYEGPGGVTMELVHPQMVSPPVIVMHDGPGGAVQFVYRGRP